MRWGSALVVGLAVAAAAPAVASARTCDDGASWTGRSSAVGGTTVYDRGELIHQDYIYDDHGAAGAPPAPLGDTDAMPAGSYRYPGADDPRYLNNAADLRELRVRLEDDVLAVRVELNTMTEPDAAVVGVGLDLDEDPSGPAMAWPHAAQLTTGGTDAVITLWGTGADLTRRGAAPVRLPDVCADVGDDALEVRVPLSSLGGAGERMRLYAASGLWDRAAAAWMAPGGAASPSAPRAYDIAFVPGEGANAPDTHGAMNWFDVKQAAALAAGDVDAYHGTLELGRLRSRASRPLVARPGFYEVIYRSSTTLEPDHEGWRTGGRFQGRYQPYSLYVPAAVESDRPLGLFVYFHGATRNHTQLVSGTNMQQQLGERLGVAIVGALGRGGLGGAAEAQNVLAEAYQGAGMLDAREVLADVRERLAIDPRRQYVGGYSMGGIATYELISFYPDEWAGAVLWAGTKPNAADQWLAGARWVPTLFVHSPTDEVVTYWFSDQSARTLQSYGYMYELHSHSGEHEHQATTDDYHQPADWFAALRAPVDPPRVTYPRAPGVDAPKLGLRADSAYWVSGVETKAALASVDLTTHALGGAAPGLEAVGPAVEEGPPDPYVNTGQRYVAPGKRYPRANELEGTLTGVTAASVDARRAGLDPTAPVGLSITTDGPATLTLAGLCDEAAKVRFAKAGKHEVTVGPCPVTPASSGSASETGTAEALGLPPARRCVSRRHFRIRVRMRRGQRLRSARVILNGRTVRVVRGRRAPVDLRGLPAGVVRVTIVARTTKGWTIVRTRRYRTCSPKRSR